MKLSSVFFYLYTESFDFEYQIRHSENMTVHKMKQKFLSIDRQLKKKMIKLKNRKNQGMKTLEMNLKFFC